MAGGRDQSGWVAAATATGGTATATKTAVSGKQHIVYGVDASFGAVPGANELLQIKDNTTVIWEGYVPTTTHVREVTFPAGLSITPGNACSAVLASGGGSVVGKVNLHGVTV